MKHIDNLSSTDKLLGKDKEGNEIFQGEGKYGPYVKIMNEGKWKYSPVKGENELTLEDAIKLLEYPKYLGKHDKTDVYLHKGQYGLYIKFAGKSMSIKDKEACDIDLDFAKSLIDSGDPYALKTFKLKDKVINIKNGPYGYYAQLDTKGKKKKNISLPAEVDPKELTLEQLLSIIGVKPKNNSA